MRAIVVATAATPPGAEREIELGERPRIDYLELSRRLEAPCVDYSSLGAHDGAVRRLEDGLRTDFRQAVHAARIVRRGRYDVVLSLSERVGVPLTPMLPPDVKHVVVVHHPLSRRRLLLMRVLDIGRRWNMTVAISRAEAEALRGALRLKRDRVAVLNTPVDTRFLHPAGGSAYGSAGDHVESLGLSCRDYPTLIRAMCLLPDVTCYLRAGSSWMSGTARYDRAAVPSNVHPKPFVPPRALRDCYAASRFVVVPIRRTSQWSAGCTSVQQAQAMGRPVVATRMPGLRDYVLDGETGILVEQADPVALAGAIDYLWGNAEVAAAMGRRARDWVEANFSLDRWVESVAALLGDLCSRDRDAHPADHSDRPVPA